MKRTSVTIVIIALIAGLLSASEAISGKVRKPFGRVLVQGARLHGSNGILFDHNDRLHIASVIGREIVIMDSRTGKIMDRLGTHAGVETPDDIAFGPPGTPYEDYLYWTSLLTGEVGRMSPGGVKAGQRVALGVNPITFSEDGRLFVALDFLGDALYEIDPSLIEVPILMQAGLGFLNGMDFGPDGYLYGPIWTRGQIVRIDVDSEPLQITPVAEGLGVPAAVKFDSKGRLHTIDTLHGEVLRIDIATGHKKLIATLEPGLDNLAFDSRDNLFVSSFTDGTITKILSKKDDDGDDRDYRGDAGDDECDKDDYDGEARGNDDSDDNKPFTKSRIVSRGGMIAPGGVAVHSSAYGETVFVGDFLSLREYHKHTGRPISIERHILTLPGITFPSTVAPDGENLVLSTWFGNIVQIWNPKTQTVVDEYEDFSVPLNAIRFQDDLVVAELGTGSVVRMIEATDEIETLADGFYVPTGLAASGDDLWIGDWATGVVWQIVTNGVSSMTPVATGLSQPEGLAVDRDGNLLVVESGAGRLSRINLLTSETEILFENLELGAEGVPGYPPTWIFNGVAVDRSGKIFVTGDIANVLYRFKP